ncbi:MerR family DNA-binding transcriptional regulator [Streptomyces olivochromogenes]|uniref:MerR family DNA-binding transcriptional regulator n=1 Tax=Streptomyces olivochromogenes TaxID=1963 RepID=UPI0036DDA0D1
MRVGELARRTGVTVRALRYYEAAGLVGHDLGDECPASPAAYRRSIRDLSERIRLLTERICRVGGCPASSCPPRTVGRSVFAIRSDTGLALREALDLPTFTAGGRTLYRRLTMIVNRGAIEHVFYPVFPPDQHAGQVLDWLRLQDPPQGETAHDREGHPLSVPRPPR